MITYVIAFDGSSYSTSAANYAAKHLSSKDKAVLVGCYKSVQAEQAEIDYVPFGAQGEKTDPMSPRATTENARRKTAVQKRLAMAKKALLAVAGVRLKEENITFKSVCIDASGSVGDSLIEMAHRCAADAIVVGTRGHGSTKRQKVGSTTAYLVTHAHHPVIVCHTDDDNKPKIDEAEYEYEVDESYDDEESKGKSSSGASDSPDAKEDEKASEEKKSEEEEEEEDKEEDKEEAKEEAKKEAEEKADEESSSGKEEEKGGEAEEAEEKKAESESDSAEVEVAAAKEKVKEKKKVAKTAKKTAKTAKKEAKEAKKDVKEAKKEAKETKKAAKGEKAKTKKKADKGEKAKTKKKAAKAAAENDDTPTGTESE